MSDSDLRAAAERLRKHERYGPWVAYDGDRHYLASVRPDDDTQDDTQIDEAWLKSAGFREDGAHLFLSARGPGLGGFQFYPNGKWYLFGTEIKPIRTRGQLRLLCRALGITLKEPS